MDLKPILVTVDFSDLSAPTVEYAVRIAEGKGRKVDLLHIAMHTLPAHAQANAPAEVLAQIQKSEEIGATRDLTNLQQELIPERLRGKLLLRRGPTAETICQVAAQGYELIVISTRGRTGLSHILLGSVAERVVRHATIPVLVVR